MNPERRGRHAYSHQPITDEALLIPVPATLRMIPVSRAKLYELIGNGTLDRRKIGARTFITRKSIQAFVEGETEADRGAA